MSLVRLTRAIRSGYGFLSSSGSAASNVIAPESPALIGADNLPEMWYWGSTAEQAAHQSVPSRLVEIDGKSYTRTEGEHGGLNISNNALLVGVTVATKFFIPLPDNIDIFISGVNTFAKDSILSVGSNTRVLGYGEYAEVVNLSIQVRPDAVNFELAGFTQKNSSSTQNDWHAGIAIVADNQSVPQNGKIHDIRSYRINQSLIVFSAKECVFENLFSTECIRPYEIYSLDTCLFSKIYSYSDASPDGAVSLPVVGFLNIAERIRSFNRGIVDSTYRDIYIDGWSEEGFAFDGRGNEATKRALVFNGHIDGASSSGITIVNKSFNGDLSRLDVIFHTGALAGRRYPVASSSPGSVLLGGFSDDYQLALVGDFISIEVPCYGNVVDNCSVKGYQDPSGINIWLWGGCTKIQNPKLDNCIIDIRGAANNTAPESWRNNQCYQIPHNVKIDGASFSNRSEGTGIFSRLERWFDSAYLSDSSIYPDAFKMHGLDIRLGLPRSMYLADLYEVRADEVRSSDYVASTTSLHPATIDRR